MRIVGMPLVFFALFVPAVAGQDQPTTSQPSLKPPLPISPAEGQHIADHRPTFQINGRFGANRYRLELATNPQFTDTIVVNDGFDVVQQDRICPLVVLKWPNAELADGTYYWRAFAADEQGRWTPPANYRIFHVDSAIEPAPLIRKDHPYLLIDAEEVPAFRRSIKTDPERAKGFERLQAATRAMLDAEPIPESYARASSGQHGNYNTVAGWHDRHMVNAAMMWLLTGESEYADAAKRWLLNITSYERWLGEGFTNPKWFDPVWTSALETAMTTHAVAVTYDALYDVLTPDQRKQVRDALVTKGIAPLIRDWADPIGSARLPRHQLANGNWDMVCACSAGVGALAVINEHPDARHWAALVRDRVRWWLTDRGGDYWVDNPYAQNRPTPIPVIGPSEPNFGPDGGYKESLSYMYYAMLYVTRLGDALRRVTGESIFEQVPANILAPVTWSAYADDEPDHVSADVIDFGDCGSSSRYGVLYAALVKHRQDGLAQWLYHRTCLVPTTSEELLWEDNTVPEAQPEPALPLMHFRGIGQVLMRSGWGFDDLLVGAKFHQNRGHHDLGTFFIYRDQPVVIDSGSADYGSAIYRDYLSQTQAHNVVIVNGRGQWQTDGRIDYTMATANAAVVSAQLQAAYPNLLTAWRRDIVVFWPGTVVTVDTLTGKAPTQYSYVLHPAKPFTENDDHTITWGTTRKSLTTAQSLFGRAAPLVTRDGYRWTTPMSYLSLEYGPVAANETVCLPVVYSVGVPHGVWGRYTTEAHDAQGNTRHSVLITQGENASEAWTLTGELAVIMPREPQTSASRDFYLYHVTQLANDQGVFLRADQPIDALIEHTTAGVLAVFHLAEPTTIELPNLMGQVKTVHVTGTKHETRHETNSVRVMSEPGDSRLVVQFADAPPLAETLPQPIGDLPAARAAASPLQTGVTCRASTSVADPLGPLDDDPGTVWASLPYMPMPQWYEVDLPKPQPLQSVTIDTARPCTVELIMYGAEAGDERSIEKRHLEPNATTATFDIGGADVQRIRVVFHELQPEDHAAVLRSIRWK